MNNVFPARRTCRCARYASVALLVLLLRPAPSALFAQPRGVPEYQVKAAFLLHFTRYVEWPDTAFTRPDAPFLMCILGADPFGRTIDELVAGETVGGRAISIVRLDNPSNARTCHLVFVAGSETGNLGRILDLLRGAAVLSVGEPARFAQQGGIIGFYLEGRNVRFEINAGAAEAAGLKISSRLLRLAKIVPAAAGARSGNRSGDRSDAVT